MSNIRELIREKIDAFYTEYKTKFHQNGDSYRLGIIDGLDMAKRILDTLPDEPVTDCHDLEEAAENIYKVPFGTRAEDFIAGAEWQKKQDEENYAWVKQLPNPNIEKLDGIEITTSDSSAGGKELLYVSNKSYNIGFRDGMAEQKRKMMDEAYEEEVQEVYRDDDGIHCSVSVGTGYKPGTIVYVITIPKEDAE